MSDNKGQNFLELLNKDLKPIELSISKKSLQLKYFGHSNFLCVKATRVIVNHAPIGEYHLRFFPQEEFKCFCDLYSIESRHYILYECKRYNNYQNLRRNTIVHFTLFLEFNSNAFFFGENITQSNCNLAFSDFSLLIIVFFFPFLSSYCMLLYVCSYKVATIVCLHTLCNKLLIKKKVYYLGVY